MDVARYCVAVTATGLGSSSPDLSALGFPPVQAAQVSVPTSAMSPKLGLVGLNGTLVLGVPADIWAASSTLGGVAGLSVIWENLDPVLLLGSLGALEVARDLAVLEALVS